MPYTTIVADAPTDCLRRVLAVELDGLEPEILRLRILLAPLQDEITRILYPAHCLLESSGGNPG
jgi:hypothetical protein